MSRAAPSFNYGGPKRTCRHQRRAFNLAQATDKPSKSLHRMLSPKGNPNMDNLAAIFGAVRQRLGAGLRYAPWKPARRQPSY